MRFLMKIQMPTPAENPVMADPDFQQKMRALLLQVNALSASSGMTAGRRVDHIIVDVDDPAKLPAIAEPFFLWLNVVPEFLRQLSGEEASHVQARAEAVIHDKAPVRVPGPTDLESFLKGEVHGADFHHAHHVKAGFELLQRHDFATAAKLFSDAVKTMNEKTGNPDFHHVTLTMGFMALIAERAEGFADYDSLVAAHPELLDKAILLRWYSKERLGTALARRTFVLPDAKA